MPFWIRKGFGCMPSFTRNRKLGSVAGKMTSPDPSPKDVLVLLPRTCKHVTFHGKRHIRNVVKVKDLEMGR